MIITSYLREIEGWDCRHQRDRIWFILMAPIKTVGHENKFSIFLTKTVKIANFKTRFFDYFEHYAINKQLIKTNDHINRFYIELFLF